MEHQRLKTVFNNEINVSLTGILESYCDAFRLRLCHVGANEGERDPAGGRVCAVQGAEAQQGFVERWQDHRGSV